MIGPQKQGAPRDAAPRDARAVVCTSAASGASGKGAEAMESAGGVVFRDKKAEALADLDGRIGLLEAFPFGLQHVLAMFVANLAPIAIIVAAAGLSEDMRAVLIQNAMLIAGIGTFIQLYPLWRVGSGLSIVMGISFTFVTVACTVAATQGYGALIGAVIVGGVLEGVLGLFAQYWRRIITPIVAAVVVTAIGFSLLGVGAASFGGGTDAPDFGSPVNLALGTISLVACLVFQGLAKGSTKQLSVLFGLVVGYVVAIPLGKVDFSGFAGMQLVSLPALMPVMPEFNPSAILSITLLFLVSATETVGDCSALTAVALRRSPTDKELSGAVAADRARVHVVGLFRLLAGHLLLAERGACGHDRRGESSRHRHGGGSAGARGVRTRGEPRVRLAARGGARRLHGHDVRQHHRERLPDDRQCGLLAAQHHDCGAVAGRRHRVHANGGHLHGAPRAFAIGVCRQLRGRDVCGGHCRELAASQRRAGGRAARDAQ